MKDERLELFREWKALSLKIQTLSCIVQNQGTILEEQIKDWRNLAFSNWNQLKELTGKTLNFLRNYKNIMKFDVYTHAESCSVWMREATEEEREENLITRNDGCVNLFKQNLSEEEVKEVIKGLVNDQGFSN